MERYAVIMPASTIGIFQRFKMHAVAFEENQYERADAYPLFPREFADAIEEILA